MPRVIVCDVNETLLDLSALEPEFKRTFGDARPVQGLGLAGLRACSSGQPGVLWGVRVQIVH